MASASIKAAHDLCLNLKFYFLLEKYQLQSIANYPLKCIKNQSPSGRNGRMIYSVCSQL